MMPGKPILAGVTAILVTLVVAAACSNDQNEEPAAAVVDHRAGSTAIADTRWKLVDGVPLVDGYPITLTFDDSTVDGFAACNSYSGDYSLTGAQIDWRGLLTTLVGCDEGAGASGDAYKASLLSTTHVARFDNELRLSGPTSELVFTLIQPISAADLVGAEWSIDELVSDGKSSSVQGAPFLRFDADGTFTGSTGCRDVTGEFVESATGLSFTPATMTAECDSDLQTQDRRIIAALTLALIIEVDGDGATVTSYRNEALRLSR